MTISRGGSKETFLQKGQLVSRTGWINSYEFWILEEFRNSAFSRLKSLREMNGMTLEKCDFFFILIFKFSSTPSASTLFWFVDRSPERDMNDFWIALINPDLSSFSVKVKISKFDCGDHRACVIFGLQSEETLFCGQWAFWSNISRFFTCVIFSKYEWLSVTLLHHNGYSFGHVTSKLVTNVLTW